MKIDPFRQLDSEFERLTRGAFGAFDAFDEFFRSFSDGMPVDVYRTEDEEFVVYVDLPGVHADAIEVSVEKNVVTVNAERQRKRGGEDRVVVAERPHGKFTREILFDDDLDADQAEASCVDGVLTLRLPVLKVTQRRRVAVVSGETRRDAGEMTESAGSSTSDLPA